jgi:small acid-soluble spore protein I (minor)
MDIREHIISNFKNSTTEEIKESIIEAINESDEITLPGLGVLFEILWKNFKDKDELVKAIKKGL